MRPLNIPVVLGTTRKGRQSAHVARWIVDLLARRAGVATALIDVSHLRLAIDDAGEAIKDADFAAKMEAADGLVLVAPEYNHSFPGLLKHALDSCLREYIHKAVGIVGVSSGPFGGARMIQDLLPVMRELGLVNIFWDVNVGNVQRVFSDEGRLLEPAFVGRADKFLRELLWMSKVLREGREHVTIDEEAAETILVAPCPACGTPMNHHADKLVTSDVVHGADEPMLSLLACPACGSQAAISSPPLVDAPA